VTQLRPCDFLAQLLRFIDQGRGVLLLPLQAGNLFGGLIAPRPQLFGFSNGSSPFSIEGMEVPQNSSGIHSSLAQFLFDERQMITDERKVEHKRTE